MGFHDRPSFKDIMNEKKEIKPGKLAKLEKGDFLALMIACASVIIPFILMFVGIIGLFILILGTFFS